MLTLLSWWWERGDEDDDEEAAKAEETSSLKVQHLPQVTQLVRGRTRISVPV